MYPACDNPFNKSAEADYQRKTDNSGAKINQSKPSKQFWYVQCSTSAQHTHKVKSATNTTLLIRQMVSCPHNAFQINGY
jgi:hypothetical protein